MRGLAIGLVALACAAPQPRPAAPAPSNPPAADGAVAPYVEVARREIQKCYERAMFQDRTLGEEAITVRLVIQPTGVVKDLKTDASPRFNSIMGFCIRDALFRRPFPPKKEEYTVAFRMVFKARK